MTYRDAEAIAEASLRPTMRFVPVKSEIQSDLQSLHRARERLIAERTALINHLRAVLLERGIIVAQGRRKLEKELPGILADAASGMSPRIRQLISDLREEWHTLDIRITTSMPSLSLWLGPMKRPGGWQAYPVSARSTRRRWWQRWAMVVPSRAAGTWRPGWDWCHVKQRPAANHACLVSASVATDICART
jgi:transposase